MASPPASVPSAGRSVLIALGVVVLLLVVAMFVRRGEHPDGTLLLQERTWVTEQVNPGLEDRLAQVVPGTTTASELVELVGEPTTKLEEDGLEVWIYTQRHAEETERLLFGIVRTGGGTSTSEMQVPVALRDGVVVHTLPQPSEDPATLEAIQSLWGAYTSGT